MPRRSGRSIVRCRTVSGLAVPTRRSSSERFTEPQESPAFAGFTSAAGLAMVAFMQAVLSAMFRRFITRGRLSVRWPDGRISSYAGPSGSGPEATIHLRDAATVRRLIINPALMVGEAYMDGGLVPDERGIYPVLDVMALNLMANGQS